MQEAEGCAAGCGWMWSSSWNRRPRPCSWRPGLFAEETSWRQRHRWLEKATMTICSRGNASSSIFDLRIGSGIGGVEWSGEVSVSIYLTFLYISWLSVSHCTWPCPPCRPRPPAIALQNFLANLYLRTWRNTRAPVYKWAHHANPLEHSDHIGRG